MIDSGFSLRYLAYDYSSWALRISAPFGGFDSYQIAFSALVLALLCGLALMPRGRSNLFVRQLSAPWFYGFLMILALCCARFPTFLPSAFNPDEGQFLAGALKLQHDPVFWRSVDGGTSGPLTYYALLLLNLIGLPLDFATARLLNLLCIGGAVALLYPIARLFLPDWAARLAPLPVLAAVLNFRDLNFLHYSSECVPIPLIATGVWLLLSLELSGNSGWWKYFALGAVVAILPFAKLQAAPMAAVLGGGALGHVLLRRTWVPMRWLAVGFASIFTCLLLFLVCFHLTGTFRDAYVTSNVIYADVLKPGPRFLEAFLRFCFNYTETGPFQTGVMMCLPLAAGIAIFRKVGRFRPNYFLILVVICLLLASFYAIYRPARLYPHYLNFLVFPFGLLAALTFAGLLSACGSGNAGSFGKAAIWPTLIFLSLAVALPTAIRTPELRRDSERWMAETPKCPAYPISQELSRLARPGDPVAIWGWAPLWYVFSGTVSSTRDVVTAGQIQDGPLQAYYRRRFMDDLKENPPKVFVDAVAPGQFGYENRATHGYEIFPELRDFVTSRFQFAAEVEGVRFFTRKTT